MLKTITEVSFILFPNHVGTKLMTKSTSCLEQSFGTYKFDKPKH